jgi:MiaB-like tRNA modifying enzyme
MQKVFFKTFGCRTNIYDTAIMQENLKDYIIASNEKEADIIVINSCTVTNSADSNVRSYINNIEKLGKKIYLTGCGVRTKGKELYKQNKVNGVFGASLKENINYILTQDKFFDIGNLDFIDTTIITKLENKTKAFIKIQEGCNFSCSYCIIPTVRGKTRSYDKNLILKQIDLLAQNGFSEFVLTGTNLGSYGKSQGYKKDGFAILLKEIFKIKGVKRVRLGSIEPIQITDEFKELLDEDKLSKHLHIALQYTQKDMLRLMNRRNSLESDLALFEFLANKGYAIGTDFIVGHPGESDKIFNEAYENLKKFPLTHIHLFTYSPRNGTKSAMMNPKVKGNIAKKRLNLIKKLINQKNISFRQNIKIPLKVLIEQKKDGYFIGYDQFFNQVKIKSNLDLKHSWVIVKDFEPHPDFNLGQISL